MMPSSLARVRPSTQSIDERSVEPEETADDVEEDEVDFGGVEEESLFVDVRAMTEELVIVGAELLQGLVSLSSCEF